MSKTDLDLIKDHFINHAVTFGEHSPGRYSRFMIDTREGFLTGGVLAKVGEQLWEKIKKYDPEVIYGTGYGAINIMLAIHIAAEKDGVNLMTLVAREVRKERNRFRLVEGPRPKPNSRAVYVDDIINSGSSFRKAQAAFEEENIHLNTVAVAVVFDFWSFKGSRRLEASGMPVERLLRRHDVGDTRADPNEMPVTDSVVWRNLAHNQWREWNKTQPLIHGDKVYFGNDRHQVFCHDIATGDILWKYENHDSSLPKGLASKMEIADGSLYFASYDGTVCRVDADTGNVIWKKYVDKFVHSAPCIDLNRNQLYIGTEGGVINERGDIICLDLTNGNRKWTFPTEHVVPCAPALINDMVVCGSNDANLYSLNPDTGMLNWVIRGLGEVKGRANYIDDVIVASHQHGRIFGISLDGQVLWDRPCGRRSHHQYLQVHRQLGLTYIINTDGYVIAYNKKGDQVWARKIRAAGQWNLTLHDDEIIIITEEGHINLLDPATGERLRSNNLKYKVVCPCDFNKEYIAVNSLPRGFYLYRRKND
jgi:outer membrane protein assembly factor BamB/orotate phosphoribosyltransferase